MLESKKAELSPEAGSRAVDQELHVAKLTNQDNIEAYLTTFECLMLAYNIPKVRWIFKLVPRLSDRAYAALTVEDALS